MSGESFTENSDKDVDIMYTSSVPALNVDYLKERKTEFVGIADVDNNATNIFRNYIVPGTERFIKRDEGRNSLFVTGLIDPEEFVVGIETEEEYERLNEFIQNEQNDISRALRRVNIEPRGEFPTTLEIITGDIEGLQSCYRHKVIDMRKDAEGYVIKVQMNIKHEKTDGYFIVESIERDRVLKGGRTGVLTSFQRQPQGMTYFGETMQIKLVAGSTRIWLVGVDPDLSKKV